MQNGCLWTNRALATLKGRKALVVVVILIIVVGVNISGVDTMMSDLVLLDRSGNKVDVIGGFYLLNGHALVAKGIQNIIYVRDSVPPPEYVAEISYEPVCLSKTATESGVEPRLQADAKNDAQKAVYNITGNYHMWQSTIGAHGSWVTELTSIMKQEFSSGIPNGAAKIPLLQPIWGTLEAFTTEGLSGRVLSGPPLLPAISCVKSTLLKPLIILPARWVKRAAINEEEDESGIPVLAVPPAV